METSNAGIEIGVDCGLYSQTAILKATYKFTGRYYAEVKRASETIITVVFMSKTTAGLDPHLREEFLNELIDQQLRERIQAETSPVRNLIIAHALSRLGPIDPKSIAQPSRSHGNADQSCEE